MDKVNSIVEEKCKKVQQYKENLVGNDMKKARFV